MWSKYRVVKKSDENYYVQKLYWPWWMDIGSYIDANAAIYEFDRLTRKRKKRPHIIDILRK